MSDDISPTKGSPPLPGHLVQGYESFLAGRFGQEQQRYRTLAEQGQRPSTMIVSCCDSRVSPEVIFDARPGELFVLRNVANLVPPYEPDNHYHGASAALEYAVMALKVRHILVLGHAQCGGVAAFADALANPDAPPLSDGDFIGRWIKLLGPAVDHVGLPPSRPDRAYVERLELEAVKQGLRNLRTFPWIATLEKRHYLHLHGAYFGVMDGRLLALDEARNVFSEVAPMSHALALEAARF
ncbi:carbonic anhydrase [Methylocystis bryophila]|uniref:Carbonic anhydrase n=1 Tax=Methylocystis bryophila TaxID=655015 RepID=A0A1W6MXQ8_9HYPH|nr:carbonic anhydrase [Methylocystis bryophila]ARN82380.1 carbonate dehydratase [Methylocystis bryophila]BDV38548.1 carbonic anhydrase [Methylocystis bryophila]